MQGYRRRNVQKCMFHWLSFFRRALSIVLVQRERVFFLIQILGHSSALHEWKEILNLFSHKMEKMLYKIISVICYFPEVAKISQKLNFENNLLLEHIAGQKTKWTDMTLLQMLMNLKSKSYMSNCWNRKMLFSWIDILTNISL